MSDPTLVSESGRIVKSELYDCGCNVNWSGEPSAVTHAEPVEGLPAFVLASPWHAKGYRMTFYRRCAEHTT